MEALEFNEFEQTFEDFDEMIKGQIEGIEVVWGMEGYSGRIGLEKYRNGGIAQWGIGKKRDLEEDPETFVAPFKIFAIQDKSGKILCRVETILHRLGYSDMKSLEWRVPGLLEKRASLGLEYNQIMGIQFFEVKTIVDVADLFRIIESSSRMRYETKL